MGQFCKKHLCILSFSPIARDGRVLRQIQFAMKAGFQVDVVGFGGWDVPPDVEYFPLPQTKLTLLANLMDWVLLVLGRIFHRFWDTVFWRKKEYCQARDILLHHDYDLVHANDWNSLPVAGYVSNITHVPVVYDAHEYTLEQEREKLQKRFLRIPYQEYLLRNYGVYISKMITTSKGFSELYENNFGWKSVEILNAPSYEKLEFHPVNPIQINLIHHGSTIKGRNIEDLIKLMPLLDERYFLNLMLVPIDIKYFNKLKRFAESIAPERIKFLKPVAPANISSTINQFDIGIHLMKADNLNHYHALPNKLFEFIMAGLGIAIYPLPGMAKLVRDNHLGVVSEKQSEESMAEALAQLEPSEIEFFKVNSLTTAKKTNAESEMKTLIGLYNEIIEQSL